MYTRILVPLDGSELAEEVLPYVRILARAFQASIELLRVFEPVSPSVADPDHGLYLDRIVESIRIQTQDYLEAVASSLREEGLTVASTVHEGSPATHIVHEAEKKSVSLIAMSTHGRSGMSRWVLGSITDKVLHATTKPLLVVRSQEPQVLSGKVRLNTVIVPLDGSELAEQVLPHVVGLARALDAKVMLLRVTASPADYHPLGYAVGPYTDLSIEVDAEAADYLDQVGQKLRGEGISSVEQGLLHGDPAGAIVDTARRTPDSMVAMTTHGRSGVGRWLMGSIADRVVRYCGDPVLVVRAP